MTQTVAWLVVWTMCLRSCILFIARTSIFFSNKNVHIGLIGRPSIWPCCLCRELMLWTAGYNGPLAEQRPLCSELRGPETFGARVLQTLGPPKNFRGPESFLWVS